MKQGAPIQQTVVPVDGGLVDRYPSNQTFRRAGALFKASNVRAFFGRLLNAPGYDPGTLSQPLSGPALLIYQATLQDVSSPVLGDSSNLYAVTGNTNPQVSAGISAATLGLSWIFQAAYAGSFSQTGVTSLWTLLSGPGTASFASATTPNTTVTVSEIGVYTFQLAATQNGVTVYSTCTIRFVSMDAGSYSATAGSSYNVAGNIYGNSSGYLVDAPAFSWSLVSAPTGGTATFLSPNSITSLVEVSEPGEYTFELSMTDPYQTQTAEVTIRFIFANAGGPYATDQAAGNITLAGTLLGATTPTSPTSDGVVCNWSFVSGNGSGPVTFNNPALLTPVATFPASTASATFILNLEVSYTAANGITYTSNSQVELQVFTWAYSASVTGVAYTQTGPTGTFFTKVLTPTAHPGISAGQSIFVVFPLAGTGAEAGRVVDDQVELNGNLIITYSGGSRKCTYNSSTNLLYSPVTGLYIPTDPTLAGYYASNNNAIYDVSDIWLSTGNTLTAVQTSGFVNYLSTWLLARCYNS